MIPANASARAPLSRSGFTSLHAIAAAGLLLWGTGIASATPPLRQAELPEPTTWAWGVGVAAAALLNARRRRR